MDNVTVLAPLDVHVNSIIVGALHDTGDGGMTRKSLMRTDEVVLPPVVGGAGGIVVVGARRTVVELVDRGTVVGATLVVLSATEVEVAADVVVEDDEP